MSNPLLKSTPLPAFSAIEPQHIGPALEQKLAQNRQRIVQLLRGLEQPDQNFLSQLEQWSDELEQLWSPISHLNGVCNSDELRDAYNAGLPKLTEYATEMGQDKALYQAYTKLASGDIYDSLGIDRRKAVDNALRDFTLSGVALPEAQQRRFGEIKKRLAELSTTFANNVLDATHGWSKHIDNPEQLAGIPDISLQGYQQAARAKGKSGYLISLDVPSYLPVMQYCDNAKLREEMYYAYITRASDQGPNAGQWDNSELMHEILALRQELSRLLGYKSYAEYSLATKMAESPAQVREFLTDLAQKSLAVAKSEFAELEAFALGLGVQSLHAWDIPYYSEKLRLQKYAISQEELRAYFPLDTVVEGMFEVVSRLFGIDLCEISAVDKWHPDVRFFHLLRDGKVIAKAYFDLFARESKKGGAWMADCRVRRQLDNGDLQLPVAFLTCNFSPPTGDTPSLLTHNEVTTLFHEFGHGLHHMLTQVSCAAVSGINGVPWDAVELPSQFLENWCWQKSAIPLISSHYQSGQKLPEQLLDKLLAAKNFQSGMMMMRQLEFALFDLRLHSEVNAPTTATVQSILDDVRQQIAVYPVPDFNRFQHGFSHIFSGGYAAGYYSYKWAEVLSADAFSRFENEGVFNKATGDSFLREILQRGGSEDPMKLFVKFRGQQPSVDALLRHSGIVSDRVAT